MTTMFMKNPRIYSITVWDTDKSKPILSREYDFDDRIPYTLCESYDADTNGFSETDFDSAMNEINDFIGCTKAWDGVEPISCEDGVLDIAKGIGEEDETGDFCDYIRGKKYCFIADDNYGFIHAYARLNRIIGIYDAKCCDSETMETLKSMRRALEPKIYETADSLGEDAMDERLKFYAYFDNFTCKDTDGLPRGLVRIRALDYLLEGAETEEEISAAVAKGSEIIADYYCNNAVIISSEPDRYLGRCLKRYDDIVGYCLAVKTVDEEIRRLEDLVEENSHGVKAYQFVNNFSAGYDTPDSNLGIRDEDEFRGLTTVARLALYLGYAKRRV